MNIPKLKKIKTTKNYHGFALEDDYSWVDQPDILDVLKDPKKLNLEVKKYIDDNNDYILEIGSNDGIFLKNFSDSNIKHLGIDASSNLVEKAKSIGVNAQCEFFDEETASRILQKYGQAKVIVITNTMHHIENCNSVAKGIETLLSDNGILIIEDPYKLPLQ